MSIREHVHVQVCMLRTYIYKYRAYVYVYVYAYVATLTSLDSYPVQRQLLQVLPQCLWMYLERAALEMQDITELNTAVLQGPVQGKDPTPEVKMAQNRSKAQIFQDAAPDNVLQVRDLPGQGNIHWNHGS